MARVCTNTLERSFVVGRGKATHWPVSGRDMQKLGWSGFSGHSALQATAAAALAGKLEESRNGLDQHAFPATEQFKKGGARPGNTVVTADIEERPVAPAGEHLLIQKAILTGLRKPLGLGPAQRLFGSPGTLPQI